MASKISNPKRKTVRLDDQKVTRGEGGETHQTAGDEVPQLTTQQGIPFSDDQNTLKIGSRGPAALEDFHFREKISTSTMNAFRSALSMLVVSEPMATSKTMTR
jgi:catalase